MQQILQLKFSVRCNFQYSKRIIANADAEPMKIPIQCIAVNLISLIEI